MSSQKKRYVKFGKRLINVPRDTSDPGISRRIIVMYRLRFAKAGFEIAWVIPARTCRPPSRALHTPFHSYFVDVRSSARAGMGGRSTPLLDLSWCRQGGTQVTSSLRDRAAITRKAHLRTAGRCRDRQTLGSPLYDLPRDDLSRENPRVPSREERYLPLKLIPISRRRRRKLFYAEGSAMIDDNRASAQ